MHRYRVLVKDVCYYSVAVSANSPDEAEDLAEDILTNTDEPNRYFYYSDGYEAVSVDVP